MDKTSHNLQERMRRERIAFDAAVLADDMHGAAKHQKRYRQLEAERRRLLLEQARSRGAG